VRRGWLVIALVSLCVGSRGDADELPSSLPSASASASAPATEPDDDPSWRAYHEAFFALASGDTVRARQRLEDLVRAHPEHPAATRAKSVLADLPPAPPVVTVPLPPDEALRTETPSRGARAELVLFQTLHGVVAGLELCQVIDCDDARPYAASLMSGGGLGLGLSILGTRQGVRAGHTAMMDSGVLWGAWNGFGVSQIRESNEKALYASMLVGQAVGLGVGALAWNGPRPTAGQVATASAVGTWATLLTAFVHGMTEFDASGRTIWTTLLLAGDAGLLAGAALAYRVPVSRGRVYLVNAGGILGLLAGSIFVHYGEPSGPKIFVPLTAGTVLGLGLAIYSTRGWDLPANAPSLAVVPQAGGGLSAVVGGRF
jgi:hypothetical protein